MTLRAAMILGCLLALAACGKSYQEPSDSEPHAVVKGYSSTTAIYAPDGWTKATLVRVDGQRVSDPLYDPSSDANVAPGQHALMIGVETTQHGGGGIARAATEFPMLLEAGKTYQPKALVQGADVAVWMETPEGQRLMDPQIISYRSAPTTTYTPIYIPRK